MGPSLRIKAIIFSDRMEVVMIQRLRRQMKAQTRSNISQFHRAQTSAEEPSPIAGAGSNTVKSGSYT